jgi:CS domain
MATQDDYDNLSPEEREIRDKADRQREAEEQAGISIVCFRRVSIQITLVLPYSWKQTLPDVDVVVPVPKGTRARDLVVVIKKKQLSIGLKGKDPIMAGDLCQDVKVEESTWTLG